MNYYLIFKVVNYHKHAIIMLNMNFKFKEIFRNLNFTIKSDDCFDEVVELSCNDAFDFSAIVGANYLFGENGFSMKGRNEVFIHRSLFHKNSLIYSPGLFGRDKNGFLKDENSGHAIKERYPKIFKGNKKLILYNLNKNQRSNIESELINQILKNKKDPEEYILFKYTETNKNIEPFIEWVVSHTFIKKGYIFENQCPFFQQSFHYKNKILTGGIPDVSAFKTPMLKKFAKYGIINKNNGILINKIPHIINFNLINKKKKNLFETNYKLILGEVKSDISGFEQAKKQLLKYKNVDLADELYFFIPNLNNLDNENFGLGFISNNSFVLKNSGKKNYVNPEHVKQDEKWLEIYLKINLLGNLPFEILFEKISNKYQKGTKSLYSYHLLDYAISVEIDEIIEAMLGCYGIH